MAGRGNFAGREKKKVKKDNKKIAPLTITQAPVDVEVVKKKRKNRDEEES
jgi:hypothetical protein